MENPSVFFGAKNKFYEEYAKIQCEIAEFTVKFTKKHITQDGLWLDLGSGTGFAKNKFIENFGVSDIISLDIAFSNKINICADFDYLPFRDNSFDKIISCSAIQWSKNIENLMTNVYGILKQGGKLIISVFEDGTLENLRKAQIDFGVLSKVSFFEKNYFENSVINAGFGILANKNKTFSQVFPNGYSALKSISRIGATNHEGNFLSRKELVKFISHYENSFPNTNHITHDYKTRFYILEK